MSLEVSKPTSMLHSDPMEGEWLEEAAPGPDDAVLPELPTLDLDLVDRRTAELL